MSPGSETAGPDGGGGASSLGSLSFLLLARMVSISATSEEPGAIPHPG